MKPENISDIRSNQEMLEGSTETQKIVMKLLDILHLVTPEDFTS